MKLRHKYLPNNKPLVLGFLISLLGALPLGYINVIGLQILLQRDIWATTSFILGVIFIEVFVLKLVSFGAKRLIQQKKLLLFIDVFTIIFFFSIAYYFFSDIGNEKNISLTQLQLARYPFVLGLLLNSLNFMQWPYWSGVFIYLFRTEKIKQNSGHNTIFIFGALLGTFSGILIFAEIGNYFLSDNKAALGKYFNIIFALLFSLLAFYQLVNFYLKNKKNNFNSKRKAIKIAS